jgi:hypothetical protein
MSGLSHKITVAAESFQYLGRAFGSTAWGGSNPTNPVCSFDGEETTFFLDWTDDHACAGTDWVVLLFLFAIVHAVSWWPRWFLYEPVAHRFRKNCKGWTLIKAEKFSQAVTAASFHTLMGIFAYLSIHDKAWLWETTKWSQNLEDNRIEPDFKFYYLLYAARYLSDMVSLFYENAKSVSKIGYCSVRELR